MQPPPPFDPAVTVSALAIQNLSNLPFTRFHLAAPPPDNPVAQRARWLEPGVGQPVALPAAALSLLAEHLPCALAAPLRPPAKQPKPTTLYVFGTHTTLAAAADLLRDAFTPDETAVWTPASPALTTRALTAAIHRAIIQALEASGATRVGSNLLLPDSNLAYSFAVSLGRGEKPHVIIRVAVKHTNARRITDEDSAAALHTPLPVFTAPMGTAAILSPRPVAGDALTASVLKRWREAGLLPSTDLPDSTVVFLTINGVDIPFPRLVVFTNEPKPSAETTKVAEIAPKKTTSATASLWRSRKRPRSPAAPEESSAENVPPKDEPRPVLTMLDAYAGDAPTAESLNAALKAQGGAADPAPVLHHPLVQPMPPPSFNAESDEGIVKPSEEQVTGTKDHVDKDASGKSEAIQVKEEPSAPPSAGAVKTEPAEQPAQSSNGIDSFLLDGDSNTGDGFDTGPGMDMTDFGAFDDDVTAFFRDGMDDKLQNVDSNLLNGDDGNQNVTPVAPDAGESKSGTVDTSVPNQDSSGTATEMKMDVDSETKPASGNSRKSTKGTPQVASEMNAFSAIDVVNVALSALRGPLPSTRPKREAVKSQLCSFYEEDLTDRRHIGLSAARTIAKRRPRSKVLGKFASIRLRESKAENTSPPVTMETSSIPSGESRPLADAHSRDVARGLYVPQRKVKAYLRLRRRGLHIRYPAVLNDDDESDSSVSEDEDGNTHGQTLSKVKSPWSFLPAEISVDSFERTKTVGAKTESQRQVSHRDHVDAQTIVDSVAVDCASACMVLAADHDSLAYHGRSHSEQSGSRDSQDTSGSPSGIREEDAKAAPSSQVSQISAKVSLPPSHAKLPTVTSNGSPPGRASGKRDREFFTLLSLLEMQMFSMNELSLFVDPERMDISGPHIQHKKTPSSKDLEHVSSATMRRVLLGLPRALETSHIFGSCFASFREEGSEAELPTVRGPLSVSDFMGGCATVFPLASPRVCVGFNKEWMESSSGALPMWEKAGFEPYSEKKNVEYVAVAPKDMEDDVKLFLRDVSATYEECSFGKHVAMPFDSVTLIANSVAKGAPSDKPNTGGTLTDADKAMAEQYHLAVTGICTKLAAVTRDHRKNPTGSPTNIVAYIMSPFPKSSTSANVALLRAVAPLVSAVPGTVPSMAAASAPGPNLPSAPWRSSPASKSVVSITVRIIPREVVDRRLSGRAEIECLLKRPLRPQLMKAVSFAVFNSIRFKRVRIPSMDGEVSSVLSRASLIPDDLMSPMTPDIIAESPGGNVTTPVSPIGPVSEEGGQGTQAVPHTGALADQSSALSPSFLHEPVVVLAGVGKHMGQTSARANIVLHLAYAYCESSSRYVFAWTDQRGEMLDMATVPVSRANFSASRRKAFWGMWARGQRWRISYVEEVHATVSKRGSMAIGEIEDWDWVINKVMSSGSGTHDKKIESNLSRRVVRRFPPIPQARSEEISSYIDVPTPATPGVVQSVSSGSGTKNPLSLDIRMPPISSVSVLSVCNADTHLFMENSGDDSADRRDFAVISGTSLSKGRNVQANAILARFEDSGIRAIEINVLRHYGNAEETEEMEMSDRSPWDCSDVQAIANTIAVNFHELRYVASPPSWPHKRWLTMYPIHMDAVRGFQMNLRHVQRFAFQAQSTGTR